MFQINEVRKHKVIADIAKYTGFVDFRASYVEWSYFLFAGCQFLLFICCAKLHNLHAAAANDIDVFHLDPTQVSSPREAVELLLGADNDGTTSLLQPANRVDRSPSVDIEYLLSKQPFLVRAFLQEGGLLLASAAAIIWCVSYPSYGSLPLIVWAFLSLAMYGLSSPLVIWVLILYGTCLSVAEYFSNLTGDFVGNGYTNYGLKMFDYPFLDLSVHNICLVFIYYSIRTRWQYVDVLRLYRKQRDTVQLRLNNATELSGAADELADGSDRSTIVDLRYQADLRNVSGWAVFAVFEHQPSRY